MKYNERRAAHGLRGGQVSNTFSSLYFNLNLETGDTSLYTRAQSLVSRSKLDDDSHKPPLVHSAEVYSLEYMICKARGGNPWTGACAHRVACKIISLLHQKISQMGFIVSKKGSSPRLNSTTFKLMELTVKNYFSCYEIS